MQVGAFSVVGANAVIEDNVTIHPNVIIYPGVQIGSSTIVHAGAILREDVIIGRECCIQNGAIIGADGFGYYQEENDIKPVPQVGTVVLGDRVDVGAQTCIDRATLGTTRLGSSVKLDNLVQIGHNVWIEPGSIVCGHSALGGSVRVGSGVTIGGKVGIADHVSIADGVRIGAGSGVAQDIKERGDYAGYPTQTAQQWRRQARALAKLPGLLRDLKRIQKSD